MSSARVPPYFHRGPGPLISVMIPSRGRPGHLLAAIDSCVSLAQYPQSIEFVIKTDDDDTETLAVITKARDTNPHVAIKIVTSPKGNGFQDIHNWYNRLMLPQASGDWLLLFNDDARLKTQNWDAILNATWLGNFWHGSPSDVCCLALKTNGKKDSNEFIMVRRRACEIMGHVFGSPYGDSWLVRTFEFIESFIRVDLIEVEHLREDLKDSTRDATNESFYVGINSLVSVPGILGRMADVSRLIAHIEAREAAVGWFPEPERPGWYRYRQSGELRPMNCCILPDGKIYSNFPDGPGLKDLKDIKGYWWPLWVYP